MKKIKALTAILLSLVILFSFASFNVSAEEAQPKEFSALCYNVAGLPDLNKILGKEGAKDVPANQKRIGEIFNSSNYDIIAVQEDFGYHSKLVKELTNYPYKTVHTGGIPGGDGMNVYSKTAIYNEKRTAWESLYGVIDHGADEMTPKGILYCVIDLGDGVLVDFYDIHADAFGDEGSQKARNDNFRQLSEMINARGDVRPVIVTGDFNTSTHLSDGGAFTQYMIKECGLKDAWTEIHNNGDYEDYSAHFNPQNPSWDDCWGRWDSVEKFLYRDGGGVKLDAKDFEYIRFNDDAGESLSDHSSASVKFSYVKTAEFRENTEELSVTQPNFIKMILKKIIVIFVDLYKGINHFDELLNYIK